MSNGGEKPQPNLFRLWVRKGSPFQIQVPYNPPIEHDGEARSSRWRWAHTTLLHSWIPFSHLGVR